MNTRIDYLYRDASNYKVSNVCVVSGAYTEEDEEAITSNLSSGEYFIPRQIGLPEKRFDKLTVDDHCWFEFGELSLTDAPATVDMTIGQLAEKFKQIGVSGWDDVRYAVAV